MRQDKRYQVFVSSTYEDLKDERQAAVEAILQAGHIPAGMELFAAENRKQYDVIRRWIDESDVFLLILGGRYGSIEPESGLSYVEAEFDYACERDKLCFSVVLSDEGKRAKVEKANLAAIEQTHEEAYRAFRKKVTSRLCSFFATPQEVKLAVLQKLAQVAARANEALTGGLANTVWESRWEEADGAHPGRYVELFTFTKHVGNEVAGYVESRDFPGMRWTIEGDYYRNFLRLFWTPANDATDKLAFDYGVYFFELNGTGDASRVGWAVGYNSENSNVRVDRHDLRLVRRQVRKRPASKQKSKTRVSAVKPAKRSVGPAERPTKQKRRNTGRPTRGRRK
jgi:hypothetical protein